MRPRRGREGVEGSTYLAGLRRAAEIDEHARDRDDDVERLHERRRASARELVDGRRARSIALASGLEQAPGDAIRSLWRAAQAENRESCGRLRSPVAWSGCHLRIGGTTVAFTLWVIMIL